MSTVRATDVNGDDFPDLLAALADRIARPDVCLLLFERITIRRNLRTTLERCDKPEPRNRRSLVEEVFICQVLQPKISHHSAFASRRCQSSRLASSQDAAWSSVRSQAQQGCSGSEPRRAQRFAAGARSPPRRLLRPMEPDAAGDALHSPAKRSHSSQSRKDWWRSSRRRCRGQSPV